MQSVGMLGAAVGLGAGAGAPGASAAKRGAETGPGEIPRRALGRTGVQVSVIGAGGHHLGDLPTIDDAIRLVHEAVDADITFFDNCWEYYNGKTENWLGQALQGRRDEVFLMTKVCTHGRSGRLAVEMLEQSLRRLRTDRIDLPETSHTHVPHRAGTRLRAAPRLQASSGKSSSLRPPRARTRGRRAASVGADAGTPRRPASSYGRRSRTRSACLFRHVGRRGS